MKVLPFCSVYKAPSDESNLTLLAWIVSEFAYLSMLHANKPTLAEIMLAM